MALGAKIGPDRGPREQVLVRGVGDEAEPEGFGGSKVEGKNDVWPDFRPNPKGRGRFVARR